MAKMIKVLAFLVAFHLLVNKEVKAYDPFDYFRFVLSWAPSLCNIKPGCKRPPPDDFLIHGLWPQNVDGPILKKCYKVPYDGSVMSDDLVQQLRIHWPNLIKGTDEKNWNHEWKSHGVCSLLWYEQKLYFNLAIKQRIKFIGLKQGMINKGIVPGSNMSYTFNEIKDAVQAFTTKVPDFTCNLDQGNNFQLKEVRLCLTAGGTIRDCPTDANRYPCTGHNNINFPLP